MAFLELVRNAGRGGDDKDPIKHKKEGKTSTESDCDANNGTEEGVWTRSHFCGNTAKSSINFVVSTVTSGRDKVETCSVCKSGKKQKPR